MPYRITLALDLFNGEAERPLSRRSLDVMLKTLFDLDVLWLQAHPNAPLLYKSRMRYMEEPPGQEDWQDVPTCLKMGFGDCLPLSTLVMREDGSTTSLGLIKVGDRILGDKSQVTTVLEGCATGLKPILEFEFWTMKGRTALRCSTEHILIAKDGREIPAKSVLVGDELLSLEKPAVVSGVRRSYEAACGDIKTDAGRFYLPESDVVVHNCEDLACWRAAELVTRFNIQAHPYFREQKRKDGSYLYHILDWIPATPEQKNIIRPYLVNPIELPTGFIEDPSKNLGMR